MLSVQQVTKQFADAKQGRTVRAVHRVSLEVREREIFALIGESGSGKSTLAEIIVGLQRPTGGTIRWRDAPPSVQLVFQNPDRSMNPYWKVRDIVTEPLRLAGCPRKEAQRRAPGLLEKVRLDGDFLERRPSECSGGQKQRIAIARALSMSPRLLVADEITSALDPVIEAEILELLRGLNRSEGTAIFYITHRLETISGFADRIAVMKDGEIREMGETEAVLSQPASEYTRALIEAAHYD